MDVQEHKAVVAKYASNLNTNALDNMAKTYAIVLNNNDAEYVACGDSDERKTVRENFLKKKLGLTQGDDLLDAAIEAVCTTMKEHRFKSRLAFYYLLADKFGKLGVFS